jgi:1,4-alpha-glucan branching enzyme
MSIRQTPRGRASLLSDQDVYLFNEGTHTRIQDRLGGHPLTVDGVEGVAFAVWAPNAEAVSVMSDGNGWTPGADRLEPRASSGIWEGFIPGMRVGSHYKFHVVGRGSGFAGEKADPFALFCETPPKTASIVWDLAYEWGDAEWLAGRGARAGLEAPISVYEVHLGSWMRTPEGGPLTYRDLAPRLADHVERMGFTHVELLPIMEHPFYGSWGYQTTGYFAPTSRYGTPQELMELIDTLHQRGIGVILDWVPSHFPNDSHGLALFDGTHLFEHADPRKGFHPDWKSAIFNYGRNEVRSFLLSSALFWIAAYHADGLRVDAVASMLYLDYSRSQGEWIPNEHGGRENLEAISFLRELNEALYAAHPDVQTIAEESTAWPMVSRPTYVGGLGFGFKWDMGWMHDTLLYVARDPVFRRFHQNELTFRSIYAFTENFMLPLSHDEVVHGKGSLYGKLPGDRWQKLANLRLLLGYLWTQPGKKLLFMGGEFGQEREWAHESSIDWHLLEQDDHAGVARWTAHLNGLYRGDAALHEGDARPDGFQYIDASDTDASVISFLRLAVRSDEQVLCVFNFTPVPRDGYRLGVPRAGWWQEIANSDAVEYGGSGVGNLGGVDTEPIASHGHDQSLLLRLPPLGLVLLKAPAPAEAEPAG